jgi:hypothetical protein
MGVRTAGLSSAAVFLWLAVALASQSACAQGEDDRGEIRGLKLGLMAREMSIDRLGEFACGSNGGPPRQRLDDWSQFAKCRPEGNGLHEVYARFDDERDYIGRAIDDPLYAPRARGTRIAGHPIILSALFDGSGTLRGLRFVSDPRAASHERRMAHMLRFAVFTRYGEDGWACTDVPATPVETPVGGIFIKQRCEKSTPERYLTLETRFLRKAGQSDTDPVTGEYRPNQFESWTRFELFDPGYLKR